MKKKFEKEFLEYSKAHLIVLLALIFGIFELVFITVFIYLFPPTPLNQILLVLFLLVYNIYMCLRIEKFSKRLLQ